MNVSVVIPCFNAEKYLGDTISSVLSQTRLPDEIVFVNDGSTDNTKYMLEFLSQLKVAMLEVENEDDKGIKISVYHNERNMGIGYTRQKGIDVADGEYIAFLSSDDVWHERFLEISMKILEKIDDYPNYGTYTDYYRCDKNLKPLSIFKCPEFNRTNIIDWALRKNMFINFSSIVFPKLLPVMFEPELRRGEDLIFLLDSVIDGFKWFRIDEPLLYYRVMGSKFDVNRFLILWHHNKKRLIKLGVDAEIVEKLFNDSYHKAIERKLGRSLRGIKLKNILKWISRRMFV